jgi:L-asparaginase II
MNPILVEVRRGCYVESVHAGALAVVDVDGAIRFKVGDVERPVFPRSAVKVFQALPLVASGAADALRLTDEELALSCASHTGEPSHVATAAAMLAKAGLDKTVLECGAHWPSHVESARALACDGGEPNALHNNCSGKHAGFVCVGCLMARAAGLNERDFLRGYVHPDHPVMREVTAALQAATGADLDSAPVGTDGCSIPTYGIALRQVALGFARVATGLGLNADHARATRRLRAAVARAPFMVAGTGRFGTQLMERLGERVFCKSGAEGVYCAALPEHGLGVAIKINDGNARAAEVALATVIERLVPMDDSEREFMRSLSTPVLKNWNGIEVGELHASPVLRLALGPQA